MKLINKIIFINLLFIFLVNSVFAESSQEDLVLDLSSEQKIPLESGMTLEQVNELFGTPDRKIVESELLRESWYYGGSVVFFSRGLVSAWSDDGTLSTYLTMQSLRPQKALQVDTVYQGGWLNTWLTQDSISKHQVLSDFLNEIK